uniref:Putative secreted protein n=1 Tax=Anopheles marajoara TaxID=58244 RepID=A0A2M4C8Q2_9DIPT
MLLHILWSIFLPFVYGSTVSVAHDISHFSGPITAMRMGYTLRNVKQALSFYGKLELIFVPEMKDLKNNEKGLMIAKAQGSNAIEIRIVYAVLMRIFPWFI